MLFTYLQLVSPFRRHQLDGMMYPIERYCASVVLLLTGPVILTKFSRFSTNHVLNFLEISRIFHQNIYFWEQRQGGRTLAVEEYLFNDSNPLVENT